jgi:hypothetical protein
MQNPFKHLVVFPWFILMYCNLSLGILTSVRYNKFKVIFKQTCDSWEDHSEFKMLTI